MVILGINAFHGDSSACIVKDGKILCAIEEERINRIKHWAGLPKESILWCLSYSGLELEDIDYIAVSRNPSARIHKKLLRLINKRPSLGFVIDRVKNFKKVKDIKSEICESLDIQAGTIKAKLVNVEHHISHIASSYLISGMDSAACISVDGFGDFVSLMRAKADKNNIEVIDTVDYPHSLGIFYTALTQFLGFHNYGDEYKVMGLSAYGKPNYIDKLGQIVNLNSKGMFELDNDYFLHDSEGVEMTWNNGAPTVGRLYSDKLSELLGKPRVGSEELSQEHMDIASSVQSLYEETFFSILNNLFDITGDENLCLAGGCIQNSLANGKITERTNFKNIFIPPSAHDGGTSIGSALWVWNNYSDKDSNGNNYSPYLGPEYTENEIRSILEKKSLIFQEFKVPELLKTVANYLVNGKIVGWFQGRSEWGPRALGNRSIICDPSFPNMKDIINSKIKRRESFRPFAPSILIEYVNEWFEKDEPVNYMESVYKIKENKRGIIPSVAHIDGTGRLQTVSKEMNKKYYNLIYEFFKIKNIPLLLNTSFNENEPIVNTPDEAIECFLRTDMDILVLNNFIVTRK